MSDIEKTSIEEVEVGATIDRKQLSVGTVGLIVDGDLAQLPVPSADPRDPLRLPFWRKCMVLVTVSFYSPVGLTAVSGMGSLIGFFIPDYPNASYNDIVHLITYPTLFMGLSNLVFVPIAIGWGRRPVYLFSSVILLISTAILASPKLNTNYNFHLGARCMLGIAAGQSEALVPLILKETFYLHERARVLAWQSFLQVSVGCLMSTFGGNMAAAWGWRNFYTFFCACSALHMFLAIFFVYETKFDRPLESYSAIQGPSVLATEKTETTVWTIKNPRPADTSLPARGAWHNFGFPAVVNAKECLQVVKHMAEMIWLPPVLIIVLMNSVYLGINIGIGTTYATPLQKDYGIAPKFASYANLGQLVVGFLALPLLGILSDWLIKRQALRHGGVHEPETRLIALVFPIIIGILATLLYGFNLDHPNRFHYFNLIFDYNAQFLAFLAASVAGQTYLLDAFPQRSASVLILVCAIRGVISFGITYGLVPFTEAVGNSLAFGIWAIVSTFLALVAMGLYFYGKPIRLWCMRFATDKEELETPRYG